MRGGDRRDAYQLGIDRGQHLVLEGGELDADLTALPLQVSVVAGHAHIDDTVMGFAIEREGFFDEAQQVVDRLGHLGRVEGGTPAAGLVARHERGAVGDEKGIGAPAEDRSARNAQTVFAGQCLDPAAELHQFVPVGGRDPGVEAGLQEQVLPIQHRLDEDDRRHRPDMLTCRDALLAGLRLTMDDRPDRFRHPGQDRVARGVDFHLRWVGEEGPRRRLSNALVGAEHTGEQHLEGFEKPVIDVGSGLAEVDVDRVGWVARRDPHQRPRVKGVPLNLGHHEGLKLVVRMLLEKGAQDGAAGQRAGADIAHRRQIARGDDDEFVRRGQRVGRRRWQSRQKHPCRHENRPVSDRAHGEHHRRTRRVRQTTPQPDRQSLRILRLRVGLIQGFGRDVSDQGVARGIGDHERQPSLLGDDSGRDATRPVETVRAFRHIESLTVHVDIEIVNSELVSVVAADGSPVTLGEVAGELPYVVDQVRLEGADRNGHVAGEDADRLARNRRELDCRTESRGVPLVGQQAVEGDAGADEERDRALVEELDDVRAKLDHFAVPDDVVGSQVGADVQLCGELVTIELPGVQPCDQRTGLRIRSTERLKVVGVSFVEKRYVDAQVAG